MRLSTISLCCAIFVLLLPNILLPGNVSIISGELKYLLFFSFVIAAITISNQSNSAPEEIFTPLLVLCGFGLLSVLWSENLQISFMRAIFNCLMLLLLWLITKKSYLSSQLDSIHVSGFIVTLVVLVGSITSYIFNFDEAYFQGNFRGLFYNSNALGHLIGVVALPYILITALRGQKGKRYISFIVLMALFYVLIDSRSRAGLLAAILSSIFILYCMRRYFSSLARSVLVLGGLAIALYFFQNPGFLLNKYENVGIASPLETRAYLWIAHLDAISQRPLLGWGLGYNPVSFKTDINETVVDTEKGNSFISLPEEIGLPLAAIVFIGLIPFAIKFVAIARKNMSGIKQSTSLLPTAIVVAGLIHAMFESWLFYFGNSMTFVFWISCIYLASIKSTEQI